MGRVSSCGSAEMLSPGLKTSFKAPVELSKILVEAPSGTIRYTLHVPLAREAHHWRTLAASKHRYIRVGRTKSD